MPMNTSEGDNLLESLQLPDNKRAVSYRLQNQQKTLRMRADC